MPKDKPSGDDRLDEVLKRLDATIKASRDAFDEMRAEVRKLARRVAALEKEEERQRNDAREADELERQRDERRGG